MHNRIPVNSTVIAAVVYSAEAALDIEFTSGARYRYFAVPAQIFHEFLSADSKGVFFNFNRRIRMSFLRFLNSALPQRRPQREVRRGYAARTEEVLVRYAGRAGRW